VRTTKVDDPSPEREPAKLKIDVHVRPNAGSTLARDVREGLGKTPKSLPPKHFYDERGSKLFDRICETPEYYPTRTELALLEEIADDLFAGFDPSQPLGLVELGSGTARKTRTLIEAAGRRGLALTYVPFDVSEEMLRVSAVGLRQDYPWLPVHGVVGDYERHLDRIPNLGRRLFVFLGGTIGNFEEEEAQAFLRRIARIMGPRDRLLLGTDLIKATPRLNAAYNDAQGLTAAFNRNVLQVINRELDADFQVDRFEHVAFFHEGRSEIQMHLRSLGAQKVRIGKLDLEVRFADEETIQTEISRKFTRAGVESLLESASLQLESWHVPADDAFALSLARPLQQPR